MKSIKPVHAADTHQPDPLFSLCARTLYLIKSISCNIEDDLRHLEFLAVNSKEIAEKQVDSCLRQHSYAGTIIGVTVLFIPFFLNGPDNNSGVIQFISIISFTLFIGAILLMLSIFRSKPHDQAFSLTKYKELASKSFKDILPYEINANTRSYGRNNVIT